MPRCSARLCTREKYLATSLGNGKIRHFQTGYNYAQTSQNLAFLWVDHRRGIACGGCSSVVHCVGRISLIDEYVWVAELDILLTGPSCVHLVDPSCYVCSWLLFLVMSAIGSCFWLWLQLFGVSGYVCSWLVFFWLCLHLVLVLLVLFVSGWSLCNVA